MSKVLCFVYNDMADFEVTLALHRISVNGEREVVTVGYDENVVTAMSGMTYKPHMTAEAAMDLSDIEALIIPGGPIRPQKESITKLIQKLHKENKLVAAICFGPQYLGRAGILDKHKFTTSCSEEKIQSLEAVNPFPWENYLENRVVRDGNVITSKGYAFVDFAFEIFDYLKIFSNEGEKLQLKKDILNL